MEFVHKNSKELHEMTYEEKCKYYLEYREFVMNMPFSEEEMAKGEQKYVKTVEFIAPKFRKLYEPIIYGNTKPLERPTVIVSNHLSELDFVLIGAAFSEYPLHFMMAKSLLEWKNFKQGYLYVNRGAFLVDKKDPEDRKWAVPRGLQFLYRGRHVVVFPEGSRKAKYGSDGTVTQFAPGATEMVQAAGAVVRPCAINNNFRKGKGQLFVNIGKDIEVDLKDDIFEKTQEIEDSVKNLWQENKDNGAIILTKVKR